MKRKIKNEYIKGMFLLLMGASVAVAEEDVKVTINDIRIEDSVYTPYYGVDTEQKHEPSAADRWIRLGVYFTTEGGWIDELEITQMAMKGVEDDKQGVLLAETVNYINLDPGDHYVYVYLHPSYVKRYDIDEFDLDSAAFIKIGNKEVAWKESAKHAKDGWSKDTGQNVKKGYLLNHSDTPFWFINYDFKEIIRR